MTPEQRIVRDVHSLANLIFGSRDLLTDEAFDSIMETLSDVLAESVEFQKLLSDPKTDIKHLEPIIKRMMNPKKKKKK